MLEFLERNKDITLFSTFRTRAETAYYFEVKNPEDTEKLREITAFSRSEGIPYVCIGGGSNVLFAFDRYPGIIIRNRSRGFQVDGNTLTVSSGELVSPLALQLEREYANNRLLPWIGLPGTFGWAVIGNAGCFGLETKDILRSVRVLDLHSGETLTFFNEELEFSHRHSYLKGRGEYFVESVEFDITPTDVPPSDGRLLRKDKQPIGWSCGSFFKNPEGTSAGKLIDTAGLKGTRIGGIRISELHGNFFLNDGTATFEDVLNLKDIAQKAVLVQFGIELEEEVKIIR